MTNTSESPASLLSADFASKQVLEKLFHLGITSKFELLLHLPLRYEDETHIYSINDAPEGKTVQVEGQIIHCEVLAKPRRQFVFQVSDENGVLFVRLFNYYGSQIKTYTVGKRVRLLGEIRQGYYGTEMVHPKCRVVQKEEPLANTLTPIYPTTFGLSQQVIRRLLEKLLKYHENSELFFDTLSTAIRDRYQLAEFKDSVQLLHSPPPGISADSLQARTHFAWRRIKFDELLAQQLSMRLHYRQRRNRIAPALPAKNKLTKALLTTLTFELTNAQKTVLKEVSQDLASPHPMQRLLQGDVGSGKTIVAALAALQAIENGHQVAVMVPTEILADQHFQKLSCWLDPLGIKIALLYGRQKKKQRNAALADIAVSNAMLVIGTHALFQEQVEFDRLGLAIIDEQHRFGVHQRLALSLKTSNTDIVPHQLMMSATPIPRTLSMSYYADLDVSVIDELPPGRLPVVTKLIDESRRDEIIMRIRDVCYAGKQVYWVCPLIEESESLQLKNAMEAYETLSKTLTDLKIGLVHGRLHSQEKTAVM
ncbi:MAG: ATP-dependent DNA helicase RecG, partial [Nitrosomonas sp.]|nr:ATP-dependent DNA helicase RecG [Nitrosomonas sp.]